MKLFALASLLSLTIIDPVFAAPMDIHCNSTGVADAGWYLTIPEGLEGAKIAEESIMGPRNPRALECHHVATMQIVRNLEDMVLAIQCREKGAVDGGLGVRFLVGGVPHREEAQVYTWAVLRGKVIETPARWGQLRCSRAHE